jgi:hypothetical protein
MAIDTAEKRRSAAGVGYWLYLGLTPNVSKDAEWRQQAAWGYSGISAGVSAAAGTGQTAEFDAYGFAQVTVTANGMAQQALTGYGHAQQAFEAEVI